MRSFILFSLLLVWESYAFAKAVQGSSINSNTSNNCIQSLKELENNLRIKEIVDHLGGKEKLLGQWTYEGKVMGFQKKMTLELFTLGDAGTISGRENGESVGKMRVCLTDKPNTLQLETSKKIILVRKGKEENTIQISQVMRLLKTPYYAFRKTTGEGGGESIANDPLNYIRSHAVVANGRR